MINNFSNAQRIKELADEIEANETPMAKAARIEREAQFGCEQQLEAQKEKEKVPVEEKLQAAYLGGRCRNGAHRDAGPLYHSVMLPVDGWACGGKAECGAQPGRSSAGWCVPDWLPEAERVVTCPRCLKKQEKQHPASKIIENEEVMCNG